MSSTKDTKKSVLHVNNNVTTTVKANMKNVKMKGTKPSKQKVLLPTLKEQQRYVVYRLLFVDDKDSGKDGGKAIVSKDFLVLHNNILKQCNALLGVFDGGKAGLMGVKYNLSRKSGIIRVSSKYVDKLKVCLGLIKTLDGQSVIVDCMFVSGMLNKALDKMNGV